MKLAVAVIVLTAAVGCGSRVDTSNASTDLGGDDGSGPSAPAVDAKELGTIENPCSDDDPGEGSPGDTPGISDDKIRIGVISDRENPAVPLPTVGIEESVQAFVEYCNRAGGINGREIELLTYDSMIGATEVATSSACRADLFALVGTGSVQDQQGITTREECGLPEVGAYSATSSRAESKDFFQAIPGNFSHFYNVGPCRYIAELFPDAVKKAAVVYSDLPAASVRAAQVSEQCEAHAGFEFVVDEGVPFGETDFATLVSNMKAEGVEYFSMVSETATTLAVLEEMKKQNVEPEVIDLGQQYYTTDMAEADVAQGAFVLTNTVPFSEADDTPTLALYMDLMDELGQADKISTLGVQAFDAGLLWATAADALGNNLTREALVEELKQITEWDGGGLQMVTNPGENVHNDCFLYLRIEEGDFVREHPDEGYDCNEDYVVESDKAYKS
jgi:ABC-type branched-subunit amino acid transport system substrate-binding protein